MNKKIDKSASKIIKEAKKIKEEVKTKRAKTYGDPLVEFY